MDVKLIHTYSTRAATVKASVWRQANGRYQVRSYSHDDPFGFVTESGIRESAERVAREYVAARDESVREVTR